MLEILLREPYSLQSILKNGIAKGIAKWNLKNLLAVLFAMSLLSLVVL
jgi:hypothetical protein